VRTCAARAEIAHRDCDRLGARPEQEPAVLLGVRRGREGEAALVLGGRQEGEQPTCAVQCSALFSAVQCSAICSAVQCSAVQALAARVLCCAVLRPTACCAHAHSRARDCGRGPPSTHRRSYQAATKQLPCSYHPTPTAGVCTVVHTGRGRLPVLCARQDGQDAAAARGARLHSQL
jgi:hypothetical protein